MNRIALLLGGLLCVGITVSAQAADLRLRAAAPSFCSKFKIDPEGSQPMQNVTLPPSRACKPLLKNGLPLPDPACSPGAINPSLTLKVLAAKGFTTKCVRDQASSATEKQKTYAWYKIEKPAHNSGKTQVCELDHIVSLELGGADTLDNLWPQCGPNKAVLAKRFFKQKDAVENYLARQVKAGQMELAAAQRGIAADWTQYLAAARKAGVK